MPNAQLVQIDAAGHMRQLEKPDAVNRAILDWLAGRQAERWRGAAPAALHA